MSQIDQIHAREILDSRGNPTVEADVILVAASAGARRFRPGPPPANTRRLSCATAMRSAICGKGVLKAVGNVNEVIARRVERHGRARSDGDRSKRCSSWTARRTNRSSGANALLAVSMATARAAALSELPLYRYLGGDDGEHFAGADDEHHQRRRTCRQQRRFSGIHGRSGRRGSFAKRCAWARRSFTRLNPF